LRQGPFGSQYTDEELALHGRVLKIAKEVTGRHGNYNGEILVLAQGWRTKSKYEDLKVGDLLKFDVVENRIVVRVIRKD
jgi:hypothetical protein